MVNKEIIDIVKDAETKSLSSEEMLKLCEGKTNIVTYPQIINYKNINELLGKHKACIILYMTKENYGHWTCIFKLNKNTIEFFDPYSLIMDDEFKFIKKDFRNRSNQDLPYLTKLLYKSKYKITYNHHKFQRYSKMISTCGRWCCMRIILRDLTLKEFSKLFLGNKHYDPDFIVTFLTLYV